MAVVDVNDNDYGKGDDGGSYDDDNNDKHNDGTAISALKP